MSVHDTSEVRPQAGSRGTGRTATTPQELYDVLSRAAEAGDVPTLLTLWTQDSAFVARPGQVGTRDTLEARLDGWLSVRPQQVVFTVKQLLSTGDTALALVPYSYTAELPEGRQPLTGVATDVLRRDPDGTWRFLYDNPFGVTGLGA